MFKNSFITVRDEMMSKHLLVNDIQLKCEKIIECVDDAFSLLPSKKKRALEILSVEKIDIFKLKENFKLVAINARAWWKEKGQGDLLRERFIDILKFLVDNGYFLVFIPMAKGGMMFHKMLKMP